MADPRLNSVHLEPVRRQAFRLAREALLGGRGQHTFSAEQLLEENSPSPTLIRNTGDPTPAGLQCWLMDGDFIYPLKVGLNTLGRSEENDVVVEDSFVSRRHCAILVHLHRPCELHDTASKNGTFLNGTRLAAPASLKSGDEIRICDRQFIFLSRSEKGPKAQTQSIQSRKEDEGPTGKTHAG